MHVQGVGVAALLLAVTASCEKHTSRHADFLSTGPVLRPGQFVHVPRQNTPIPGQLPSPCTDEKFRNPVYSLDDVSVSKRYTYNRWEDENAVIQLNFTLRDTANNYALRCVWGPFGRLDSSYPDWLSSCLPEDPKVVAPDEFQTRTLIEVKTFAYRPVAAPDPISVSQQWMCSQKNGSYPLVYRAAARPGFRVNVNCPTVPDDGITYTCNVTTPLPMTMTAEWTPPTLPSGSSRLTPRPDPPYVPKGLSPPPEQDCTDMSLAHPDWTVENAVYTLAPGSAAKFNLTLTSRALKMQAVCQSTTRDAAAPDVMKLSCTPATEPTSDPFRSQSKFSVEYRSANKSLSIQHDWVCGDPKGTYKTDYRAARTIAVPLVCDSNNSVCRIDKPLIVQGELRRPLVLTPTFFPPPRNANFPGCTAGSAKPGWEIKRFFFKQTTSVIYFFGSVSDPEVAYTLELELRNRANNFTEWCSLRPRQTEGWLRCRSQGFDNLPGEGQRDIETWAKFNPASMTLDVNQTWYCNDTDVTKPLLFQGGGSVEATHCGWHNETLPLVYCGGDVPTDDCREEAAGRWCALNAWDPDKPKDTAPNPPATIAGALTRTETLPEHELTDPDPKPGDWSCTANSVGRPVVWRLVQNRGPFFSTGWNEARDPTDVRSKVMVSLENSALATRPGGHVFPLNGVGNWDNRMSPYMPNFTPTTEYAYNPQGGYYKDVVDWRVRFDPTNGYLELSHNWDCLDKHPGWRTVFTGTWRGFLKLNCTFPARDPSVVRWNQIGVACSLADGDATLVPRVSIDFGRAGRPDPE